MTMRRLMILTIPVLLALGLAPLAQAKKIVPPTPVATAPSIDGAVYTTVDLNDSNYPNECKNGNPAVNCNQYTAKQFVFLNGGPAKNKLTPDGVYFFTVLAPSGQANPADSASDNLSSAYDCYKNREIVIQNGEVVRVLGTTDPTCIHNSAGLPAGGGHKISGPLGPFVQLYPYLDTPNPGGVYIMGVCFVSSNVSATAPVALADPTTISPSLCKYDAFKVMVDTSPPVCRLYATNAGPPKSITVLVQDAGAGLESVVYSGTNLVDPPATPVPLTVGSTDPFYIIATKDVQSSGSTLAVTVTDVAGNVTKCDPAFGLPSVARSASVNAGHQAVLRGIRADQARLSLRSATRGARTATVLVNGRPFAKVLLSRHGIARLNLAPALRSHSANRVAVAVAGSTGTVIVHISN